MSTSIIICEACGKKYRMDESQMRGDFIKLKCENCKHIIEYHRSTHRNSSNAKNVFEDLDIGPPGEGAKEKKEVVTAPLSEKVRFGLSAKVFVIMILISLIPFGVSWFVFYNKSSSQTRTDTERLMEQTAQGLVVQSDEWLDKNIRVLNMAAQLPEMISMNRSQQEPILKRINAEYPWTYLVFTMNPQGMNVARSDDKALQDYSDRSYYKDVAAGRSLVWQNLFGRTSKKPSVVLSVPIKAGDKLVGVLAGAMTIEELSQNIAKWKKGDSGFAFLVDDNLKVVAHQTTQYETEQKDMSDHPLIAAFKQNQKAMTIHFINENGNPSLGHVRGNKLGWVLAVQQEDREVFQTLKGIRRFALILLIVTVVVVSLVAFLSSRSIINPIRTLTQAAERMSLGDMDMKIEVRTKDEIGLLAQAIKRMQMSLKMGMSRLRRK